MYYYMHCLFSGRSTRVKGSGSGKGVKIVSRRFSSRSSFQAVISKKKQTKEEVNLRHNYIVSNRDVSQRLTLWVLVY